MLVACCYKQVRRAKRLIAVTKKFYKASMFTYYSYKNVEKKNPGAFLSTTINNISGKFPFDDIIAFLFTMKTPENEFS